MCVIRYALMYICPMIPHNVTVANRALHAAAQYGYSDCLEVLLNLGGSVNLRGAGGNSPLHSAMLSGDWAAACAQVLILNGASVNAIDDKGNSALHLAASFGDVAVVELLLQHGAEQLSNNDGHSPLDLAELSSNDKCSTILKAKLPPVASAAGAQKRQEPSGGDSSVMKELQHLRLQNAGYRNKCQELDDENTKLKEECAVKQAQVLTLRTEVSQVNKKVAELQKSRDGAVADREAQASETEALRVQCEEYRSALAQYHKGQVNAEKKLAENAAIIASLHQQAHEHTQQRTMLQRDLQETKEEHERLKVVLSNLEAKAAKAAQLQADLNRTEVALTERNSELQKVRGQVQYLESQHAKVHQELSAVHTENNGLKANLSKLEQDNQVLKDRQHVTDRASRQLLSMLQTEKRQLRLLQQNAHALRNNMEISLSQVNGFYILTIF